ncbi:hypothetical protein CRV15_30625 (plasmid) [Streptomyces clavuligerus]|uniref:Uncharacterized protein n=1 Tax=Streptomyces clavuligerus TaxID=1901 RepID=B5GRG5_STRCL|nr:hypothetical protein SSCG_01939 [Streptomyces clavuligerus]EFG04015.1 Hypothetical protein SCLAV_p0525 [Streptomyces clavuligerus]QCS09945.1 hypothetical protein CRV15_30625 [Streptomyces clavuligerus]QPJ98009.1 hypothetical protein GE265_33810 [Streptomyces clavuligerus]
MDRPGPVIDDRPPGTAGGRRHRGSGAAMAVDGPGWAGSRTRAAARSGRVGHSRAVRSSPEVSGVSPGEHHRVHPVVVARQHRVRRAPPVVGDAPQPGSTVLASVTGVRPSVRTSTAGWGGLAAPAVRRVPRGADGADPAERAALPRAKDVLAGNPRPAA